jgi:tRNA-specific 2-thiouridylase
VFITITVEGYPCTAGEDRIDAMRAAAHLKIPFLEIDLSSEYRERVFKESLEEFGRGNTPNPDALCNREIKFGLFFEWARANGADMVATGHYAQIRDGMLYKGADPDKDQSYFLWAVPEAVLRRTLFPIGHLKKPQVRALAQKSGLPNAARKDSQGLCFLGPVSIGDMLKKELHPAPGAVLNEAGEIVGAHEGAALYTMGQRHGFTLAKQGPDARPRYVIAKDLEKNTITVSESKFPAGASRTELRLADANWIGAVESGPCLVRYRYRQQLIEAELDARAGTVILNEPHYAPAGQSLVAYKHERCLGGGVIREVRVY